MAKFGIDRKPRFVASLLFLVLGLCATCANGASDCAIGLLMKSAPTLDGLEIGDWNDASVIDSTSPCFQTLTDFVAGTPDTYPMRPVTVKSKRYQRGTTYYLGFLFEVHDATTSGPCALGKLCIGEKIVMHFNRVINGDAKLNTSEDLRFTITHKWQSVASPPAWCVGGTTSDCVVAEVSPDTSQQAPISDASCTAVSGVDVKWGTRSALSAVTAAIRKNVTGGGYRVELEVPLTLITANAGDLTDDIGVAFAVVNDFGKNSFGGSPDFNCTGSGTCEGAGASFPVSLPETNDANPIDAVCDQGWVVPKQWGVGYRNAPPGQVTISRNPDWWNSDGIAVFECSTLGYTYYPVTPCKIQIQAALLNNGATTRRKVVFLWAKHGSGDPLEYNFVDLKDVVVNAGTSMSTVSTTVSSDLWAGMPKNEPNHPCLRVYIFPETLSAADEATLRAAGTGGVLAKADLDSVVANNGVADQNWAQKNISRHDTITQCPIMGCGVASNGSSPFDIGLVRIAQAADTKTPASARATRETEGSKQINAAGILMSKADLGPNAEGHVIVQARAVAYRLVPVGRKPLYNFVENFGGIIQLFPVEMVQKQRELPVEFQVSNASSSTMRVKILTDVFVPSSVAGVTVKLAQSDLTLQPRSTTTVKGTVKNPNGPGCPGPFGFLCDLTEAELIALLIVILLLAIVAFVLKRRRRHP